MDPPHSTSMINENPIQLLQCAFIFNFTVIPFSSQKTLKIGVLAHLADDVKSVNMPLI